MTETPTIGQPTNGKLVNLGQLQVEMTQAGIDTSAGLGMSGDRVYTYLDGVATDFPSGKETGVNQCIADHVALRDKTDAEYATEFQDNSTSPSRKQDIRDITAGLLPREQVPMTAADMPQVPV